MQKNVAGYVHDQNVTKINRLNLVLLENNIKEPEKVFTSVVCSCLLCPP